jgi:OmpR family response regulator RpaB
MHSILIIDDDERLAAPLGEYFSRYGLDLHAALHPQQGLTLLDNHHFDMVILDIMLPDMDGFEVCRKIRKTSEIPVLMLTARGDVQDRVEGLELGADDYLAKPFEPRELVARIQNILKRTDHSTADDQALSFENLEFDPLLQRICVNDREVNLTSNEYQLLKLLINHAGQPLSRDEITSKLRGANVEIFSRAVDISISRLRQKLKPTNYIKTVWGAGYQFIAPES